MNFDELNEIVAKEAGINICPVCGVPFTKYNSRQKTCASAECKKAYRAEYFKKRTARLREEDIDLFRKKHNEAQKKHRHKKKRLQAADNNLKKTQEYWNRREQAIEAIIDEPDGREYAQRQVEKTLSQIPKIDVNIGGAKDDILHSKDISE